MEHRSVVISLFTGRDGHRAVPATGDPSCGPAVGCPPSGHLHVGPWWVSAGALLMGAAVFLAVAEWRPWRRRRK
jgi:hypothetical protein